MQQKVRVSNPVQDIKLKLLKFSIRWMGVFTPVGTLKNRENRTGKEFPIDNFPVKKAAVTQKLILEEKLKYLYGKERLMGQIPILEIYELDFSGKVLNLSTLDEILHLPVNKSDYETHKTHDGNFKCCFCDTMAELFSYLHVSSFMGIRMALLLPDHFINIGQDILDITQLGHPGI
ncbi:hypothetical protein DUI87_16679 [Hirundo rustica rustica]|uniref:Uncharacterized protein n=1 Tax=Hirundo rustica rustica TaxID=333673 RepID=A0A3M0K226_HIRRU|nr:hypothetical protein DUI87_16679 [Hirundo rustica rustica]